MLQQKSENVGIFPVVVWHLEILNFQRRCKLKFFTGIPAIRRDKYFHAMCIITVDETKKEPMLGQAMPLLGQPLLDRLLMVGGL